MAMIALAWLLLLTITGFRILERQLPLPSAGKSYRLKYAAFKSLLTGIEAALLLAAICTLIATSFLIISPDHAHDAWGYLIELLEQLTPITATTMSIAGVSVILVSSFLTAPLLRPAILRVHGWVHIG
ncbi:hypothetical protein [Pseudomonas viridiflava]|uniref:hypothetical protein n=1 Tax=Pseudomonas viridiflava TaxID=33069 RepID=UPI000F0306DB|nr:hypothetical protein [Pseudomonas viridiflava]